MKNEMWLIWKQPKTRRRYKVGVLTYDNKNYTFSYVDPEVNNAKDAGFSYFPGFKNIDETYVNDKLFSNIETRLPNTSRADYLEILNSYDLNINFSKIEILKATKGRLVTDNFEFIPSFDENKIEFDVAGTRYCLAIKDYKKIIQNNDKLLFELEPDNKYDKYAIKIILKKHGETYHLGYVPRYYSKNITKLLKNNTNYSAMIKKVNFDSNIRDEYINVYVKLIFMIDNDK